MLRSVAVLGMDGCPGGWIAAEVDGRTVLWHRAERADELLGLDVEAVGIDIPIGLPERGRRPCDDAAKAYLRTARSSVFYAPPRSVLGADDHPEAVRRCRAAGAPGMSIQAWGILRKIAEVDASMSPERQRHVVEMHPEVSFRRMGEVTASKKTARGAGQRLIALQRHVDVDLADLPDVPLDDALDALAAAWSAARYRAGTAVRLGGETDARGLRMEILA